MLNPTMQQDGRVRLMQAAPKATEKTISFFNAYCTGLDMSFQPGINGGAGSFLMQLQISPQRVAVGPIVHENYWPVPSHGAGESFTKQQPPAQPKEPSAFCEGLHTALDVVGMIPILGEVADGANAALYTAEGDYASAALSAAAMVPGAGNVVGAAKLAKRGAKLIAKARSLKGIKQLRKHCADLLEKGAAWVGKPQRGSTEFLGSPRLSPKEFQKFKKQAKELGVELETVKDKKMLQYMDMHKGQAAFSVHSKKIYVRKGATYYEVKHELSHAKHFSEIGKDTYQKLPRHEKETYVYEQLMKEKNNLTPREIDHATIYVNGERAKVGLGPLNP